MASRLGAVTAGVIIGAAFVALAIFLHHEGVVLGGAWAGIIGLLGLPVGLLGVWLAWPRKSDNGTSDEGRPSVEIQSNTASHHGTIFAVQDGQQNINREPQIDITEYPPSHNNEENRD